MADKDWTDLPYLSDEQLAAVGRELAAEAASGREPAEYKMTQQSLYPDADGLSGYNVDELKANIEARMFAPVNPSGIRPTEFKVLIEPDEVQEKIGNIYVPEEVKAKEKYATTDGTIIAISHLAFSYATAEEWGDEKPKAGDRVAYAKYAGARRKGKDGKDYLLVNDKDVVAVIES